MVLGFSRLPQHASEEASGSNFSVPVGHRDASSYPPSVVFLHPQLVVSAPGESESVALKNSAELVEAWRHGNGSAPCYSAKSKSLNQLKIGASSSATYRSCPRSSGPSSSSPSRR